MRSYKYILMYVRIYIRIYLYWHVLTDVCTFLRTQLYTWHVLKCTCKNIYLYYVQCQNQIIIQPLATLSWYPSTRLMNMHYILLASPWDEKYAVSSQENVNQGV